MRLKTGTHGSSIKDYYVKASRKEHLRNSRINSKELGLAYILGIAVLLSFYQLELIYLEPETYAISGVISVLPINMHSGAHWYTVVRADRAAALVSPSRSRQAQDPRNN